MTKEFVRISDDIGFNRNKLLYWQFTATGVARLFFEDAKEIVLSGNDIRTFRNWIGNESEQAPVTYQPAAYGSTWPANPTPRRGKKKAAPNE